MASAGACRTGSASGSGMPPDGEVLRRRPGRGRCRRLRRRRPRRAAGRRRRSPSAGTSRTAARRARGPQVQSAEDDHQLRVGRHRSECTRTSGSADDHFASMAARSWPVPITTALDVTARPVEGSRSDPPPAPRRASCPASSTAAASEPLHFAVDARILRNTLAHAGAILDVSHRRRQRRTPVIVKDLQRHPVRGETIHVDLLRVRHERADPRRPSCSSSPAPTRRPASPRAACSARRRASSTSRRCPATSRTRSSTTSPAWR